MSKPSPARVVLSKKVAEKWLAKKATPEYRLKIFGWVDRLRGFPSLLRSFREGKLRIGGIDPVLDLGVKEGFDSVTVWSSDRESLVKLRNWVEKRGLETSGVW